jgi:hypothetical protein
MLSRSPSGPRPPAGLILQTVELGLGALDVLSTPGAGRVVAVYQKAAYLRLPAGMMALTTFEAPSGPVHVRSTISFDGLEAGDRVTVAGSLLQAGRVLLDLSSASIWRGPVPTPADLQRGAGLALELVRRTPASALAQAEVGSAFGDGRDGVILGLPAHLGGAGPGLTPAGDDCLAGILFVARVRWGEVAEQMLVDAAVMAQTNDIARMFLIWAARGQSIEPVHRFLTRAVRGDSLGAARALDELMTFGATSGADLALGLRLGMESLPSNPPARPRAAAHSSRPFDRAR